MVTELDHMAEMCRSKLRTAAPDHPAVLAPLVPPSEMLPDSKWNPERCQQLLKCINDVLFKDVSFCIFVVFIFIFSLSPWCLSSSSIFLVFFFSLLFYLFLSSTLSFFLLFFVFVFFSTPSSYSYSSSPPSSSLLLPSFFFFFFAFFSFSSFS